jgi:Na+-driven multidrug efflux pump
MVFFRLFLPGDEKVIAMGAAYLRIIAIQQLPTCFEGIAQSVFRGFGKTTFPAVWSLMSNVLRVILAWVLSRGSFLGQEGIWWAIALSCTVRCIGQFVVSVGVVKKFKR